MSLKTALDMARSEIKLLCKVATRRMREAGMSVDPPEKTYRHILRRINAEARRKPMNDHHQEKR